MKPLAVKVAFAAAAVAAGGVAISPGAVRADAPVAYVTPRPAIPTVGPMPTLPPDPYAATSAPQGDTPPPQDAPPPGYTTPQPQGDAPAPGYDTPPPGYGTPPPDDGTPPQSDRPRAQDAPPPYDTPAPYEGRPRGYETPPSYARPPSTDEAVPSDEAPVRHATSPPSSAMATLLPVPAPAAGSAMTQADLKSLYENVRDAVNAIPLPPYVAFTFENASRQGGTKTIERLKVVVRNSDAAAVVRTLRDGAGNTGDYAPQVVTGALYPMTLVVRVGDFPLSDFGLRIVAPRPGIFEASGTPEPAPNDALRTLASVTVVDLPYAMTDLGAETIGGRTVYHLGLQPKRDPGHHVLRQIWIDPDTYLPVRYVAERYVEDAVPFSYFVTVDTKIVAGRLVNTSAAGHFEKHQGADQLSGDSRWRITEVGFPRDVPTWAFTPGGIAAHADEMIPGL